MWWAAFRILAEIEPYQALGLLRELHPAPQSPIGIVQSDAAYSDTLNGTASPPVPLSTAAYTRQPSSKPPSPGVDGCTIAFDK